MQLIAQGAEAKIFKDNQTIIKQRFQKNYRVSELDTTLRKSRTRREAKVLQKLQDLNFPSPSLLSVSDQDMTITMQLINAPQVKNILTSSNATNIAHQMGTLIAKLHKNNIIHGDLTTSNMLLKNKKVHFIDFGLSHFSNTLEDKAVDLYLLQRALHATHPHQPTLFKKTIAFYKKHEPAAMHVLERLKAVQKRGRNKNK